MRSITRFGRLALIALLIAFQASPTFAQQNTSQSSSNEMIHLQVGDIFEILPVHSVVNATYTWILTQNGNFLEASRAPSYRKRLIQPGQYTLYAEIDSGDGTQRISRTITLDYAARQPGENATAPVASGSGNLVATVPVADVKGNVVMPANSQLVQLVPINPDVIPLGLDTNLTVDSNGDGIPDNDIEGTDTFFHTNATPLYLWITDSPLTTHSISVTAAPPDGAKLQKVNIMTEDIARAQGVLKSPVQINAQKNSELSYTFNAVFDNPAAATGELLYQWQFGDGQESLSTKADHTYAADGTYKVSLLVRNLRDGSEVASTSIAVNAAPDTGGSAASQMISSAASSIAPSTGKTGSSFGIWSILLLILVFIVCLSIGLGIIFLIGKMRKGKPSLADRLETMEQTMVKSPTPEPAPLKIAPPTTVIDAKIKEPPASIAEREKEVAVERPAPEPVAKAATTPAWLNPAPTSTPKPAAVAPTPVATVQAPKPVKPTPAPTPTSGTPAWLQTPAPVATAKPVTQQPQKPAESAPVTQPPKPTPTPAPQMPKPVSPQPPMPKPPVVSQAAVTPSPKVEAPVAAPTPATVQPTIQKPIETPTAPFVAPQPQTSKPSEVSATPSTAPIPPTPKPASITPIEPPVPEPKPMPTPQMDIPRASDDQIAIIRAESLNQPDGQNG